MSGRDTRLQERFNSIRSALELSVGRERAFAAAMCAWGMMLDSFFTLFLEDAAKNPNSIHANEKCMGEMLQTFHRELCDYLTVEQKDAIDLSVHFKEVTRDIFDVKG